LTFLEDQQKKERITSSAKAHPLDDEITVTINNGDNTDEVSSLPTKEYSPSPVIKSKKKKLTKKKGTVRKDNEEPKSLKKEESNSNIKVDSSVPLSTQKETTEEQQGNLSYSVFQKINRS
jgi:hypothetical protein